MKKHWKWIAIVIGVIIAFNLISSIFEEEPEPIPETKECTIEKSEVYGENSDVFTVIPGKYTIKLNDGKIMIKTNLKLGKTVDAKYDIEGPTLRLKDDMGMDVTGDYNSALSLDNSESSKMITFLHSEPGTEQSFIFTNDPYNSSDRRKIMKSTEGFILDELKLIDREEKAKKEAEEEAKKQLEREQEEAEEKAAEEEKAEKKKSKKRRSSDIDDLDKAVEMTDQLLNFSKSMIDMASDLENLE